MTVSFAGKVVNILINEIICVKNVAQRKQKLFFYRLRISWIRIVRDRFVDIRYKFNNNFNEMFSKLKMLD